MLQIIRDKAQGWIAWTLVILIAITFIFVGSGWLFTDQDQEKVAEVNGQMISLQQFTQRYEQARSQNPSLAEANPKQIKAMLLDGMIREIALTQSSEKKGFRVSDEQVNELVKSIPILQENDRFSYERLNQLLHQMQLSQSEFYHHLEEKMLMAQLEEGVTETSFILDSSFEDHIRYLNQKRHVNYATLDPTRFADGIQITEDALKEYYDQHHAQFMTDETVQLEYVLLDIDDIEKNVTVTEEEAKAYYDGQQALFLTPEAVKVAHILISTREANTPEAIEALKEKVDSLEKRLQAGESFETLAREYSNDPASSQEGGLLDWISKGEVVPEFENAAFALKEKGDISAPVKTSYGFHIIKLLERQAAKTEPFADVKSDIIEELKEQKAEDKQVNLADQMVALAYDHPDSLQPMADKLDLEIQTSDVFSRKTAKDIFAEQAVLNAAFSPDILEYGQNSDLIKIEPSSYIVLRAKAHHPSKLKAFDEVRDEVANIVRDSKIKESMKAFADKVILSLKSHQDLEKAAKTYQLAWQDKTLTRAEMDFDRSILNTAFTLPEPAKDTLSAGDTETDKGYAIVVVDKITDGNINDLPKDRIDMIKGFLANSMGQTDFDLYVSEVVKHAKVERYLDDNATKSEEAID